MNNLIQITILISTFLTAITTIVVFLYKLYKLIKNVDTKFEGFEKNLQTNTLSTLRLIIINEDMPLSERVSAGEEYVKLGGNGAIHAKYEALKELYKEECKRGNA